jgi:hypothetical protein
MSRAAAAAAIFLACLATSGAAAAERARADVDCIETKATLVYDCTLRLTARTSGAPIAGAEIVVGADMPSMPMMHTVPPVKAAPTTQNGEYLATIELEMYGEWLLSIDVAKPFRDRVLVKRTFRAPASETGGKPK